ncbi:MAG: cob(I)yrinic acid a,c-diamide adenosyltransferase [Patescibacteria group bacterium]
MIIIFTGDGKGKTTASLGQAVRAVGRGKNVLMIQFIKGPWQSGEDVFVQKIKNQKSKMKNEKKETFLKEFENLYNFDIKKMGLGFVGILGDQLPREEHAKAAKKALECFKEELPKRDLIILDEVNVAVSLNLITVQEVLDTIKNLPKEKLVIFTGRGAPQEFIDAADLVTEMKDVKHPFWGGELGKTGVEF